MNDRAARGTSGEVSGALRNSSEGFKKMLLMEAAIFHAWFGTDEQKAKVWAQKSESSPPWPLLSQLRLAICMH